MYKDGGSLIYEFRRLLWNRKCCSVRNFLPQTATPVESMMAAARWRAYVRRASSGGRDGRAGWWRNVETAWGRGHSVWREISFSPPFFHSERGVYLGSSVSLGGCERSPAGSGESYCSSTCSWRGGGGKWRACALLHEASAPSECGVQCVGGTEEIVLCRLSHSADIY